MSGVGSCAVIIPTWRAESWLPPLLASLRAQSRAPERIIVAVTESGDRSAEIALLAGCEVLSVTPEEFNHGGTRNRAAALAREDFLVFLTQDALPADAGFVARLLSVFAEPTVGAAYARQLPRAGASPPEEFARAMNYPEAAELRTRADLPRLGVRGLFFSNVASAVRRDLFAEIGGFPEDVIMNEDMILCDRVLGSGWAVAYAAQAAVFHSHDYSVAQQFRRYFDIGVFFAQRRADFGALRTSGEGVRFARRQIAWLIRTGHPLWAVRAPFESGAKFVGFRLGLAYRSLPRWLVRRLSMHRRFWGEAGPCGKRGGSAGSGPDGDIA